MKVTVELDLDGADVTALRAGASALTLAAMVRSTEDPARAEQHQSDALRVGVIAEHLSVALRRVGV